MKRGYCVKVDVVTVAENSQSMTAVTRGSDLMSLTMMPKSGKPVAIERRVVKGGDE
jgi:hypothetical protein